MPLSLYEITVPVMIASFAIISKFLDRGRAYADEKGIAHAKLLNARLADDMMSLGRTSAAGERHREVHGRSGGTG